MNKAFNRYGSASKKFNKQNSNTGLAKLAELIDSEGTQFPYEPINTKRFFPLLKESHELIRLSKSIASQQYAGTDHFCSQCGASDHDTFECDLFFSEMTGCR